MLTIQFQFVVIAFSNIKTSFIMTFKFVFIIMYRVEVYLGCYNFIVIIIYIALKEHNIRIKINEFISVKQTCTS